MITHWSSPAVPGSRTAGHGDTFQVRYHLLGHSLLYSRQGPLGPRPRVLQVGPRVHFHKYILKAFRECVL